MIQYELWDVETGNRVGAFLTLDEARACVRGDIERYGWDSAEIISLALVCLKDDGSRELHYENLDLVKWAIPEIIAEHVSPQTPPRGLAPEETPR